MIFENYRGWSLRKKTKVVLAGSALMATLFVGLGIWRYVLFNHDKSLIQETSGLSQVELANNFTTTQIIGDIQADLVSFIQTASPADLEKIQYKILRIVDTLPADKQPLLNGLLVKIHDLENLLKIFRANNEKALKAGNTILAEIEHRHSCGGNKLCREALLSIGQAYRNSHPHYLDVILSGDDKSLEQARVEINNAMEGLDSHLYSISYKLPSSQAAYLNRLTELVYNLDEAMTTVVAVKRKVLDSEAEIHQDLSEIEFKLAATSLDKSEEASALMTHGLGLASNYVSLMLVSMIGLMVLILALGWAMYRALLPPLVSLVDLLKNFSRFILSIDRHTEESEYYLQFNAPMLERPDEIGDVVRATKELLDRMQGISIFRKKIEADSSVAEVFRRLGQVFLTRLGLTAFAILEVDDEGGLVPAYCSPPDLEEELPEFNLAGDCRCKRTGQTVYSLPDPEICRVCGLDNLVNYCCVPMLVGGSVIGVVIFLMPFSLAPEAEQKYSESLAAAQCYLAEAIPVIEAKRAARRLEDMATTDQLTGLYNRHYLEVCQEQVSAGIRRRGSKLGVLLCDIDFFKRTNDTFGHDAGDQVLSEIAAILLHCVRSSDLVFRFGGEEFLILLQDVQPEMVDKVAEKIRARIETTGFKLNGSEHKKTISIGVCEFNGEQDGGLWEAVKQADVALYHAKESGRNRVVRFTPEMWTDFRF